MRPRLGRLLLLALGAMATPCAVLAGERAIPVPALVIYPGDKIEDSMLVDSLDILAPQGTIVWDRARLIGKVARRTLLPGRPIPPMAVEEPRAVTMGALVSIVYQDDGLSIVTKAQALQNGFVGQVVQARNIDSGLVVTGVVQADGSILIQGG
ncbi:flagellar basal body P-ring formation chaperone FlgA [Rhodoblastus sp.]|uniref:flagellar basal body P-ring formation chaperone FlgA n=1 Tax=Rhodoblastus sp. TaxID=1962975 RepID=UPI0026080A80|nr:flagellar basal body P-ring formation chaperone FlgA [Rhodoblastus sp.]